MDCSVYSDLLLASLPSENWKYMCFLCSNILCPSDIVLDKHGFHRLHPLVYLPACGKINEHTVHVLVLRKFQLCLVVFIFFCQTAMDVLSLFPIRKKSDQIQCIPAGKGMGSQQAFGIWYTHVCEQVDMIKVSEWETIPDFSNFWIALNICWCFLFWSRQNAI